MQGDCFELMKNIPDGSVDMVLADPPYGTTRNKWDIAIPFELMWEQYRRVAKENAAILLFGQPPFSARLIMSNLKNFRYEWVWEKTLATGFLNANRMPLKAHENILVFYRKLPVYNPQKRIGFKPCVQKKQGRQSTNYGKCQDSGIWDASDGTRYPVDVIKFASVNTGGHTEYSVHPTQKPVALLEYLIRTYTNEGDTVLDNCMGSGSTGVACVNTGRSFIGIELDAGYFETAKQRIEAARE